MSVSWEIRRVGEDAPEYLPTAELFTICIHSIVSGVQELAGYVDYACADQISRIELLSMAKEFNLETEGCKIWYLDGNKANNAMKEILTDMDALAMANSVGSSGEVVVYINTSRKLVDQGRGAGIKSTHQDFDHAIQLDNSGEETDESEGPDLEGLLVGDNSKGNNLGEEADIEDSDYSFGGVSDVEDRNEATNSHALISMEGGGRQVGMDEELLSNDGDSDELHSCSSTDPDELMPSKPKYIEFNEDIHMDDPQLKIGMKFRDFKQFKEAVKNYGIKNRYVMNFKPNDTRRCKAICTKGCPFYLWASVMVRGSSTVQIKSGCLKHECAKGHRNRHVSAEWIAKKYMEQFRADPAWKLSGIMQAVKLSQEVEISRLTAFRAKAIALREIDGDEQTQMSCLYDYRLELLKTHPGSTIKFRCEEGVFQTMYVCLAPLRNGFLAGCRRVICVDGCFLKGLYGGQLLSAVGIDANNCSYPVAWAIVNKENRENWAWFLELLGEDLSIGNSHGWAFVSDRQKGLLNAVDDLFPNSEHRFCVRHIHTNFRKHFMGKGLKDQMFLCAKATYPAAFDKAMNILKGMSIGAYQYMKNIAPQHWSRAYFQTQFKCDILLNNLCEGFNSHILEARTKGIVSMNEIIRTQLMVRIQKRRDSMKNCTTHHCPKILKKMETFKQLSRFYTPTWSGGSKYQVVGPNGQFVVDKDEECCSCRVWQLTGLPCSHAVSVLYHNNRRPEDSIHPCYSVNTYLATYGHTLNPTHGRDSWPKSDVGPMIPPVPVNKKRGRRTLLRRKEFGEEVKGFTKGNVSKKGGSVRCGLCGATGHNRRFHASQPDRDTESGTEVGAEPNQIQSNREGNIEGASPHDRPHMPSQGSQAPLSQVISAPEVNAHGRTLAEGAEGGRGTKIALKGGKGAGC